MEVYKKLKNQLNDNEKKIILFLGIVLIFFICRKIVNPIFQTCDDAIIRDIIAGNYSGIPDGHAVFVGYPLAWFMSCLYKIIPGVEWYGNIWSMGLVVSAFAIIEDILFHSKNTSKRMKVAISIFILLGLYMPVFIVQQFTILAGVLAGTAVYFVFAGNKKKYIFVFMLFSFFVRSDMCFVAIPFILLGEIYFLYLKRENLNAKFMTIQMSIICLMMIGVVGIGKISDYFAYSSEQWKNYMTYNKERSQLYDYTDIINNDSYKEELKKIGINQDKYYLLKKYMIYFDNDINKNTFEITKSAIDSKNDIGVIKKIKKSIVKVIKMSIKDYWQYNLVAMILIVLVLRSLAKEKKLRESIFLILAELGREIIIFYLEYSGRLPDRVYTGIFMLEIFFLIKIMIDKAGIASLNVSKICGVSLILAICMCQNYNVQLSHRNYMIKAYDNINCKIAEYCKKNTDKIYFINMPTNQYVFDNRDRSENMCILSMYLTGSELMNRYTFDLETKDIGETLYQYDNYRYIIDEKEDIEGLKAYFTSRFDNCIVEIEDSIKIGNDKVFSVVRLKRNF